MTTHPSSPEVLADNRHILPDTLPSICEVSLLTGGYDKPYVLGLAMALISKNVGLDVIGSDHLDSPEMHSSSRLNFLNLRGKKEDAKLIVKIARVVIYYARLIRYAAAARPRIFHILWNNKIEIIDRTLLMMYYKVLGKKIALTAHNVNAGERDLNDSVVNRITLRVQYRLADHIFVHTDRMKQELLQNFGVRGEAVTVIPFGINNSVPDTVLTRAEAKRRIGLKHDEKVILFFGAIGPYKGLEYLADAFQQLASMDASYRLIIAGLPKKGAEKYLEDILQRIDCGSTRDRVIQAIKYIPDEEIECYFKCSDVLALPYTHVFQSGVLFLSYNFGLPVIGTDVGSIREEIIEGKTGYLCKPRDSADLMRAMKRYFESNLFQNLETNRQDIRDYANATHSWDIVGDRTLSRYTELLVQHKS